MACPAPRRIAVTVSGNAHLHLWRESLRVSAVQGDDVTTTDRQALAAAQLFVPDYPEFAAGVALRTLAALVCPAPASPRFDGELLGAVAGGDEASLRSFLVAHHLTRDELLRELRREERLTAALAGRPASGEVLADLVLAAADGHGVLATTGSDASRWERLWLRAAERALPLRERRVCAVRRALAVPPGLRLHEPFVVALKLARRFAAARDVARAALAVNDEVAAMHSDFAVQRIDAARVAARFAEQWGVSVEDFDVELADRGFAGRDDFLATARAFYMANKFRPATVALSPIMAAAA